MTKLTPAQVRALKDPNGCKESDFASLDMPPARGLIAFDVDAGRYSLTAVGRVVLAAHEGEMK